MSRYRPTAVSVVALLVPLLAAGAALPASAAEAPVAPVLDGPAALTASSVLMQVRSQDATATRLRWTRTTDGQAPVTREAAFVRDLVDQRADLRDTGLQAGRTYTYAVSQVTPSGTSPAVTFSAVPTAPPSLTSSPVQLSGGVGSTTVRGGAGAGTTSSLALAPDGDDLVRVATDVTGDVPVIRRLAQGQVYALRGVAHDRFGNRTAIVDAALDVPLDDTAASRTSGAVQVARSGAYGGASTVLVAPGASASLVTSGRRLQVLGERCPTCGQVDVLVNGVRQARVDTYAARRSVRQVLWSARTTRDPRTAVLSVRAVGTAGRPAVVVDAVGERAAFGTDGLRTGESLTAAGQLAAGDHVAQVDGGRLVVLQLRPEGTSRTAFRAGSGIVRLTVQHDGNAVARDRAGRAVFQTRTAGQGPSVLVLQDDGNLVLRREADGVATWASSSGRRAVSAPRPVSPGTPPPAAPALASPTTTTAPFHAGVLVAQQFDDLVNGDISLQRIGGSASTLLSRTQSLGGLAVARDGSRYARVDASQFRFQASRVVVQGVDGSGARVLDQQALAQTPSGTGAQRIRGGVAISSDGGRVVWRRDTTTGCRVTSSRLVTARSDGSGRSTVISANGRQGFFDPVFVRDDLLLASVGTDDLDVGVPESLCGEDLPVPTGLVTMGLDGKGGQVVAAPDATTMLGLRINRAGTAVTYVRFGGSSAPQLRDYRIETAPLTVSGTAVTIGTPTVLTPFGVYDDTDPHFSADGTSVVFSSTRPGGWGRLWSVPVGGGTATPYGQPLNDRRIGQFAIAG